jgi:ABC-2 type transport system permease protein
MSGRADPVPSFPLFTLLRMRASSIRNILVNLHKESALKIIVVTSLGLAFWIGLFALFNYGFAFVNATIGPFRLSLIQHMLSVFFLAIIFMLVFSNAVISFTSLFKAPETAFLFYKLIESLVFSSWAVIAIGVPLMVSYGLQNNVPWYFYPAVVAYTIPFIALPAAAGSLLGLVLTYIVPRNRNQILGLLGIAIIALATYVLLNIFDAQRGRVVADGSHDSSVRAILSQLGFARQPMIPSYWISEGILAIAERRPDWQTSSLIYFGALSSSALFTLVLGWFLAGWMYERTYSVASGAGSIRRFTGRSLLEDTLAPLQRHFPQVIILLVKDIKSFLRDPSQWSQVLIFFGILVLYIGNLRNFNYPLERAFYQNLISFLNLGATCMTLATLTSRFIFPQISLEGTRFWVLGLVPIKRRDIVISKFLFSLAGSLLLTLSLVFLSNYILRGNSQVFNIQLFTAVMISIGLSGLTVGMGALFPSFHERNPSKIVSGFGGTLTLILSISLVVLSILGEAIVCHRAIGSVRPEDMGSMDFEMTSSVYMILAGVAVLNLLAAYVPMSFGIRALEKCEF